VAGDGVAQGRARRDAKRSGVSPALSPVEVAAVVADTRAWLEKAVIGLELCPFARAVYLSERIRYSVSSAEDETGVREDLARELVMLHAATEETCETTLLILPRALLDFTAYNDFLDAADRTVDALGLRGDLQIASFHPRYQFAGTARDDIENFTNRSPYPLLHLLRESSIERAVAAISDTAGIFQRNIETLRRLGFDGWRRIFPDA
jgi:hypothetical protein